MQDLPGFVVAKAGTHAKEDAEQAQADSHNDSRDRVNIQDIWQVERDRRDSVFSARGGTKEDRSRAKGIRGGPSLALPDKPGARQGLTNRMPVPENFSRSVCTSLTFEYGPDPTTVFAPILKKYLVLLSRP